MKTILTVPLAAVMAIGSGAGALGQSSAPSLGDYARAVRKAKPANPAAKVYDNDTLPMTDRVVTSAGTPPETSAKEKDQDSKSSPAAQEQDLKTKGDEKTDKRPASEIKPGQPPAERQQALEAWKEKIAAQKNQVDLTARELDVLQREYRLRSAEYYADAGARLRNPAQWDTEDAKYKQNIADKQKALDGARAKLSELEEGARKAGAPSSITE